MYLVVLFGLPGVGKLTVGRELAAQTGFALFHNHLVVDVLTTLFPFGSDAFVDLREELWLAVLSRAASENVSGVIFTFAPESTVRGGFLPALRAAVEARGGRVALVELRCSADELERRITAPDRTAYGKLRSVETFRALHASGAFDSPSMPEPDVVIEGDALNPAETARRIADQLFLKGAAG